MRYNHYGQTGKMVSNLGFGCMRFSPDDEEGAIRAIHLAVQRGINYFDTAPGYCRDKSETFLGNALASLPSELRDTVFVSTKSSIDDDKTADAVRKRIDDQLSKLKIPRIHFYNMWCIMDLEHFQRVVAPNGPYEGVVKAKEEGLVEHIVCSTHAPSSDIITIVKADAFEGYTLGYNILNYTYRIEGVNAVASANRAIIAMNPLGGGLLTRDEQKLNILRDDESETFIAAALKFTLSNPMITIVLSGMANFREVEANVQTAESVHEPDPDTVQRIIDRFESLGESFCTGCRYCLEHCPEQIQIHLYASLWDKVRLKLDDEARRVYGIFTRKDDQWFKGKRAIDCTRCGECEAHCPQRLPIRQILENCDSYFERKE
ncbi:aldo/keto reductase [bacterium]|nr:aldo/keto reductase [bacterium]